MDAVSSALVLSFLALLLLLYFLVLRRTPHKPYPPGPRGWDLVRANLVSWNGTLPLALEEWSRRHGDVVFCPLLAGNLLFLNSPSATRELFVGKATEQFANDRMWSYVADVMCHKKCLTFSPASAPHWTKMRKLMHSSLRFYGEGVAEFEELMSETLHTMVKSLDSRCGQDLLMKDVVHDYITNIIATLLTGEIQEVDSELCRSIKWFNVSVSRIVDPSFTFMLSVLPFLDYVPGTYHCFVRRDLMASKQKVLDLILKDKQTTRKSGTRVGIVDKLLEHQSNGGSDWMTDDHVKGFLMDVLSGGIITSTLTLNVLCFHLLHHPEGMRAIQKELDAVVGPGRRPALSDHPSCHYTEAFVLESMRCVPFLPLGLDHLVTKDVQLRGWLIPKGTVAFTGAYAYNQSPELWTDPHLFRPERFLDDQGHLVPSNHPSRHSLLSFGTGKRICVGEKFARARIFLFVSWLLQSFDILPPSHQPLLPLHSSAWSQGVMDGFHLKPYHCCIGRRQR